MAYPFPPLRETLEAALNKPKTISLPIQGPPADMSSPEAAPWHNALLPEFDHTKVKLPNPIVARPRPDARFGAPPTPNKQRFDPRDAPIYMPPDGFGLNPSFGVKAKPNSKPAAPFGPFIEGPPKPSPEVPYDCDPGIRSDSPGDNFDCDPGISYKGPDDPYDWDPDISVGTPNRKPPALPFGVPAKPKSASPFDNLVLPQNLGPRNSLPIRRGQPSARDPYDCDPGFYPKGSGDNGYDCDPGFYPKGSGDNGYDCDPGMTPKISHSMPPFNPSELFGKPQPTANAGPAFHTWEDRQPWPPSNRTGPNFQTMEDRHLWRPSKDAEPNVHTLEDRRAFQPRSDTGPNVHTLEDNYPRKAPEDNNVVLSPSIFENADLATLQQHSQRQLDNDAGRIRFKEHLIQRQHYLLEEAKQAHADSWAKLKAGGIPGPKVAEALWDHNYKKHDVISRQYDLDWSQYELAQAKAKYNTLDTWHRTTFAEPEQDPAAQEPTQEPEAQEQPPSTKEDQSHEISPLSTIDEGQEQSTLPDGLTGTDEPAATDSQDPSQSGQVPPPPDHTSSATVEEPDASLPSDVLAQPSSGDPSLEPPPLEADDIALSDDPTSPRSPGFALPNEAELSEYIPSAHNLGSEDAVMPALLVQQPALPTLPVPNYNGVTLKVADAQPISEPVEPSMMDTGGAAATDQSTIQPQNLETPPITNGAQQRPDETDSTPYDDLIQITLDDLENEDPRAISNFAERLKKVPQADRLRVLTALVGHALAKEVPEMLSGGNLLPSAIDAVKQWLGAPKGHDIGLKLKDFTDWTKKLGSMSKAEKIAVLEKNGVKKISGRYPINAMLGEKGLATFEDLSASAKEIYKELKNDPSFKGVKWKKSGYPDFTRYAAKIKGQVNFTLIGMTGGMKNDTKLLKKALVGGGKMTVEEFDNLLLTHTLHHVEDTNTVQLIRKDIHDAFKHSGGRAVAKEVGWGGKIAGFLGALFLSHSAEAQAAPDATLKDKADGVAHDIGVWVPGGAEIDMALDGADWLQWNGYQHFWDFLTGPLPEGNDSNQLPDHLKKKFEKKGYK